MEKETPSLDSSKELQQSLENIVKAGRRADDQMRLRELELQTNFQIKTLSESLNLLKTDFISWRDSLNDKIAKVSQEVDTLKFRITIVIALVLGQMADAPQILMRLFTGL